MAESASTQPMAKRRIDDITANPQLPASGTPVATQGEHPYLTNTIFAFQPELGEEGNSSPRSKVTAQFKNLNLRAGADASGQVNNNIGQAQPTRVSPAETVVFDFAGGGESVKRSEDDDVAAATKRHKMPKLEPGLATRGPNGESSAVVAVDHAISNNNIHGNDQIRQIPPKAARKSGVAGRLSSITSRSRRRAGTPPLGSMRRKNTAAGGDEPMMVRDPVRAALTWQEDEITLYDPDDKDDDGTGINGIGFKPTPAVAYSRIQRRKQQLAEYKKREEGEARARRNQRRREAVADADDPNLQRQPSMMRVSFADTEPSTMMIT